MSKSYQNYNKNSSSMLKERRLYTKNDDIIKIMHQNLKSLKLAHELKKSLFKL
jgi:hypothetical protein